MVNEYRAAAMINQCEFCVHVAGGIAFFGFKNDDGSVRQSRRIEVFDRLGPGAILRKRICVNNEIARPKTKLRLFMYINFPPFISSDFLLA